jgi:protein tyrosine phosphatase (PTP) superfamily phosphohydrolase (DUF442 family)
MRDIRRAVVAALIVPVAFVGWTWASGNVAEVAPGVFRSGQLGPEALTRTIRSRGIKTILNLRGRNIDQPWYRAERSATLTQRATQIDVALASDHWMSREQARSLFDVLTTCERPVLIHCEWGAERTGLAAAFAELLRPGATLNDARAQFSTAFLFLPVRDGLVMRGHLDRYASWLSSTGRDHSPAEFHHWVFEVYRPGLPSREHWPCNPYPLLVVTHPVSGGRWHEEELWGENRCPPKDAAR